jgi:predicted phage tail component-like protein
MAFYIDYSGFRLTDYVKVTKVKRDILPPREVMTLDIPARHGQYYSGFKYGMRKIDVDITLIGQSPSQYVDTLRFLAYALDVDTPSELSFSDEPNKVYYAIVSEATDMDEMVNIGTGTISFLCPEPFAYGISEIQVNPVGKKFTFDNKGTAKTYPKFTATFSQDATNFNLISPDGVIQVGYPSQADKIILPAKTTILNDSMTSLTGWVNAGTSVLDNGNANSGTASIDATLSGIKASTYGADNNGWHGVGLRKDFAGNVTIKDFEVQARLWFSSDDGTKALDGVQQGKVEIMGFTSSGTKLFKMQMRDTHSEYEGNTPEIYIGNSTFIERELKVVPKKVTQKTKNKKGQTVNTTKTVYPTHAGTYNDFFGQFVISRKGNKWYAKFVKISQGKEIKSTLWDDSETDKGGKYPTGDLAYIVIYIAQYKNNPVVRKCAITDLQVIKHNLDTTYDIPKIIQAGQVLEIDCAESSVYIDGNLFMNDLDIGSEFFGIESGKTEVIYASSDNAVSVTATYTERFL